MASTTAGAAGRRRPGRNVHRSAIAPSASTSPASTGGTAEPSPTAGVVGARTLRCSVAGDEAAAAVVAGVGVGVGDAVSGYASQSSCGADGLGVASCAKAGLAAHSSEQPTSASSTRRRNSATGTGGCRSGGSGVTA